MAVTNVQIKYLNDIFIKLFLTSPIYVKYWIFYKKICIYLITNDIILFADPICYWRGVKCFGMCS